MNIKLNKKNIFNIIFYTFLFWAIFYISWFVSMLENMLSILILIIFFYAIYFVIKSIFRSKKIISAYDFASKFLFWIGIFLFVTLGIFSITIYSFNQKNIYMPEYTLTNWQKTVVYQWMIHIAEPDFYEEIAKNLKNYKEKWFIHFFESVKPWKKESQEDFNKAIWVKFDKDLYKNISENLWLVNQDYQKLIWDFSQKDINVDLSLDEIVEEYKKNTKWIETPNMEPIDLKEALGKLTDREKKLIWYIFRWILIQFLWNDDAETGLNKELWDVILWKRNKVLADEVLKSQEKNIYITYGLLHFDWFFKILKENDKNWKITKTENIKAL